MTNQLHARRSTAADWPGIWAVLEPSIRDGLWFPIPSHFTNAQTRAFWCAENHDVFVGVSQEEIVWTYYICPVQLGGGAHVANGAYAVAQKGFGTGLGSSMLEHSLQTARAAGYRAMQYNTVLSTNERAVRLYQKHGFKVVGTVPRAYLHPALGYVDTYIMYRPL